MQRLPQSYGGIGADGLATNERRSAHLTKSKGGLRDSDVKTARLWTLDKGSIPINLGLYFTLLKYYYSIELRLHRRMPARRVNVLV